MIKIDVYERYITTIEFLGFTYADTFNTIFIDSRGGGISGYLNDALGVHLFDICSPTNMSDKDFILDALNYSVINLVNNFIEGST